MDWKLQTDLVKNTEKLLLQFLRDLHVDDTATSFNDLTKATEFCHLTKSTLASGFKKW